MQEDIGVNPDSPQEETTDVEEVESSTTEEVEQDLSEPTEEQGEPEQHIPYDRFKEVNDEKNYWREQAQTLSQQTQQLVQPKEEVDPYAQYSDPQTKLFYQEMDKRMAKMAKQIAAEEKAPIIRQNEILTQQLAQIQHKMFKETNTDVKEGSPEETRIAQLVSMGVPIEEASWAVMGPKRASTAKAVKQVKKQQKIEMKAKANLATSGSNVPNNSGLPSQDKTSFMDDVRNGLDKDWNGIL